MEPSTVAVWYSRLDLAYTERERTSPDQCLKHKKATQKLKACALSNRGGCSERTPWGVQSGPLGCSERTVNYLKNNLINNL